LVLVFVAVTKYLTEQLERRNFDFGSWFQRFQSILLGWAHGESVVHGSGRRFFTSWRTGSREKRETGKWQGQDIPRTSPQ
jgi:hypothetical protein